MAGDLESVLRRLEEAAEFARTYRFEMTDGYRQLVARDGRDPSPRAARPESGRNDASS